MSRSMVEFYEERAPSSEDAPPFALLPSREDALSSLKSGRIVDIVIIGSDLPCAVAAHLLSLNGVRVLVLLPGPIDTSATASLDDLLDLSNLPLHRFATFAVSLRRRWKALERYVPHRCRTVHLNEIFESPITGIKVSNFLARPLLVDDGACVAEALLSARREGAVVLPYAQATFLELEGDSGIKVVGVRDFLSSEVFEVKTGGVVVGHGITTPDSRLRNSSDGVSIQLNGAATARYEVSCSAELSTAKPIPKLSSEMSEIRLSGGATAILCKRAVGPAVVVLRSPHGSEEIPRLETELRKELGLLTRRSILPAASFLAGDEIQSVPGAMLLPSSSPLIAFSIADKLSRLYARATGAIFVDLVPAKDLTSPGFIRSIRTGATSPRDQFISHAEKAGVDNETIERAIKRWGDRVRYIGDFRDGFISLGGKMLRGELGLAVLSEQVMYVDDLHFCSLRCTVDSQELRSLVQKQISALLQESFMGRNPTRDPGGQELR